MDPRTHGTQVYLPGTTDRINQLAWVNLTGGGDNAILGYNSGVHLSSSYTNNVLLGTNVARAARSMASTVLVGAAAGRATDRVVDTVGLGYNCLSQATDVGTSVIVGASAGTRLRGTTECVAVGYRAMQFARGGTATVVVGSEAARSFQGQFNTIVGAQCAQNVTAEYSTIVGSLNMNRRSGGRVELHNSVVLGENIRFDNPVTTETLRQQNAVSVRVAGNSYYDPTHVFPDQFLALGTNGRVLYYLEESRDGFPLTANQHTVSVFESLRLDAGGSYTTSWGITQLDEQKNVVVAPYQCVVTATSSNATHIQANVSVNLDGAEIASKLYKTSVLPFSLSTYLPYMDVSLAVSNGNVAINAVLYQGGVLLSSGENVPVSTGYNYVDNGSGFLLETVETVYSEYAESGITYLEISSDFTLGAAYSAVQYSKNADSLLIYGIVQTADPHILQNGAVDALDDPETLDIILVDSTASPPRTGNVSTTYSVGKNVSNISTSASFCLTETGAAAGAFGFLVLEEYRVECDVVGNNVSIALFNESKSQRLFDSTSSRTYGTYKWSATGTNTSSIPIDISSIRAGAQDVWIFLDMFWNVDRPQEGISLRLRARGYSSSGYVTGAAPLISHDYFFTVVDNNMTVNSVIYGRSTVEFFASSEIGKWRLRDVFISTTQYRVIPLFSDCVFIGSNFTVTNTEDRANIFLLSLGPSGTLMRGTANSLEIFAPTTSFRGPITIGNSPQSNYLAFRGTRGDGFTEMVPRTYIGERVYEENTQKSELLLFKGDDAPDTDLGPDRVRVLGGQFRVDVPAVANVGTYQYPGTTFDTVSQVNVQTVFMTDAVAGTQMYVGQSAPTLVGNRMLSFALSNNTTLRVYVKGTDGVTRSANLMLS